ncbi:MAG: DUF4062 domain-containing protein [Candidatus Aminicenantes bacterium]|nr:DUF4062 domain-containing protein [Candidatus Aminicenantes bacterium]
MKKKRMIEHKCIFLSSVQKELQIERYAIKEFVEGNELLKRFFEVFLFEDLPSQDRKADDIYLEQVELSDVCVGLFGNEYGVEDANGISPTEREFDHATLKGKPRLIFIKGTDDKLRHPKMLRLIHKAGSQLIRRKINSIPDLTAALYAALVEYMENCGDLRILPFDASFCPRATLDDIAQEKIEWFLETAKRERNYALPTRSGREKTLTHLNLLDDGRPTNAAVLLFSGNPQRFLPTSEIKCLHFHGTEVRKPIPSYQIFKGTVFELVDQAVDFILSKVARRVGTREQGPQAPVAYELPKKVVAEAIINAVAHRDYSSNASVQVMLFVDRLEVWNPGELPPTLTPESLRHPHTSIPRNPLIADPFFLTHYIEKAGTGTLDMIERCREVGIPEPDFEQRAGQFVVTIWRDWLTDEVLAELGLSDRQMKAISYVKVNERITNKEYQKITGVTGRTVLREFKDLLNKGVFEKVGQTGRGTYYILKRITRHKPDKRDIPFLTTKGATKGSKGS